MSRRKLCQAALAFVLGIVSVELKFVWLMMAAGVLIGISCRFDWQRKNLRKAVVTVVVLASIFLAGRMRAIQTEAFQSAYESAVQAEEPATVQGIIDKKEIKNEQYYLYLKKSILQVSNEQYSTDRIIVISDSDEYSIGNTIVVKGIIEPFRQARNQGNFDEVFFYKSQGIACRIRMIEVQGLYGEACKWREQLYRLQQNMKRVYASILPKEEAGVLAMMTVGDRELMDAEIKSVYQKAGISHMLVISGLHISLFGMGIYGLIRKLKGGYYLAGAFGGIVVVTFGYFSGMGMSAVRAIVMFLLMAISQMMGRSYDTATALAVAGASMLYENPGLIHYAGFVLSVSAVLGASTVNKIISGFNKNRTNANVTGCVNELKSKISQGMWMSLAIQLTTWPILAYYYYEISVYAIVLNVILLPLLGVVLSSGMVAGMIGMVSMPLARVVVFPAGTILRFYYRMGSWTQGLPGALRVTGCPSVVRIAVYYSGLFTMLCVLYYLKRVQYKKVRDQVNNTTKIRDVVQEEWNHYMKMGRVVRVAGTIMLAGWILLPTSHHFELDVLDVGQGVGSYLCTENGTHLFFDGGSTDTYQVGKYRILPFLKYKGIDHIDWWFVSHADEDHISGLLELLEEGYTIKHLAVSQYMMRDDTYKMICDAARDNHTEVVRMRERDKLHIGNAELTCLYPVDNDYGDDRNAGSMTLLYEEKNFTGIFAGDLAAKQEQWIVTHYELPKVTIYQANHHGSRYSSCVQWLDELQPDITTISCGADNSYGHPGAETLDRIAEVGSECYLTMKSGQISICRDNQGDLRTSLFLQG